MNRKKRRRFSTEGKRPAHNKGERISLSRYLALKHSVGRDLLRIHGGPKFFSRILPWLVFRRYLLFEGSPAEPPRPSSNGTPVRVIRARLSDVPAILRVRPGYYTTAQVRERLEQGHQCFIVWSGAEPVCIRWAFIGSIYLPFLDRTLVLAGDEAYFDEVYSPPPYRKQKYPIQSYLAMISWLHARGFKKHYCLLTSWDTYLRFRYRTLGLKCTGEVRSWNFWRWRRVVLRGGIQDLGGGRISIGRGSV